MLVKVWNDNKYPHTEMFKGEKINIPAGGYIEMDEHEANEFRGKYTPIIVDFDGQPDQRSYKMIRIEKVDSQKPVIAQMFGCNACGKSFPKIEDLEAHTDEMHLEQMADQEFAEKRRGPGRPRKEAIGA